MPLGSNSYGKSGIRLVRVARRGETHDLQDLTVAVRFEGDFESAHVAGDNSAVLPNDTMKNSRSWRITSPETSNAEVRPRLRAMK